MTAKRNAVILMWMQETWPLIAPPLAPNHSVLAARITIEVGRRLGASFQAIPVDIAVLNGRATDLMEKGVPVEDWDFFAASVGVACENELSPTGMWPGHMIVGTDELIADVTATLFNRPEKHLELKPWILPRPPRKFTEWSFTLPHDDGTRTVMRMQPRPDVKIFRQSREWQSTFRPYADRVVRMIVESETAAAQILENVANG